MKLLESFQHIQCALKALEGSFVALMVSLVACLPMQTTSLSAKAGIGAKLCECLCGTEKRPRETFAKGGNNKTHHKNSFWRCEGIEFVEQSFSLQNKV